MITLHGCPRCAGALVPDDEDGRHCLVCGYVEISAAELAASYAEPVERRRAQRRTR